MKNEVTEFLRNEAKSSNKIKFTVFNEVSGTLDLYEKTPIEQSSGAVYGIFAISDEPISGTKCIKGHANLYPVYWGKDISPPKRIGAHAKGYKDTGNAKLKSCAAIKGKKLIWGSIFVSKYKEFEKYIYDNFPPLIGSSQ